MALLYERAGCLTAKNGGFWPGQSLLICFILNDPKVHRAPGGYEAAKAAAEQAERKRSKEKRAGALEPQVPAQGGDKTQAAAAALGGAAASDVFAAADGDSDGRLNRAEMRAAAASLLPDEPWDDALWPAMCADCGADPAVGFGPAEFAGFLRTLRAPAAATATGGGGGVEALADVDGEGYPKPPEQQPAEAEHADDGLSEPSTKVVGFSEQCAQIWDAMHQDRIWRCV